MQHNTLRKHGDQRDESQRFQAQQAGREQPAQVALDAALERAGELAQLGRLAESRRVLEINFLDAIKQDQDEAARAFAIGLKPFFGRA